MLVSRLEIASVSNGWLISADHVVSLFPPQHHVLDLMYITAACLEGHDGVCFNGKVSGYFTPGTFQQYVLAPASYVTPIPDGLSSAEAAPMLCAGVTVYSALRKSGAQSGQWVALLGAGGGLGHIACQIASKGMAMRVIGIDADAKKGLVMESGAEHFVGLSGGDTAAKVLELTGGLGVSAALVLTAANGAYASAPDMLKFGGRLVCVGYPEGEMKPIATAFPQNLIAKAQSIIGVAVGNRQEAIETLELASRGLIKTHYRVEKMDKLTEVSSVVEDGNSRANSLCRFSRKWNRGNYRVELFWTWRRNRILDLLHTNW